MEAAEAARWGRLVTGSFRDGILMVVVILVAITLIWLAYGWALGVPGAPGAP